MCKISLFSFLLFVNFHASCQELLNLRFDKKIVYKLSFQTDTTQEKKREEMMELLLNDTLSLFRSVAKGQLDSAEKRIQGGSVTDSEKQLPFTEFHFHIIKNGEIIETFDRYTSERHFKGENDFVYKEMKRAFEWKLTPDTLQIGDFLCQRADLSFGNRNWVAWFNMEMPIADGPYKFCGLPGLIVRIYDEKKHWQFDLMTIANVHENVVINADRKNKYLPTTKKNFLRNKRIFTQNAFEMIEASSGIRFPTPEDRAILKQNMDGYLKRNNNWIELVDSVDR